MKDGFVDKASLRHSTCEESLRWRFGKLGLILYWSFPEDERQLSASGNKRHVFVLCS